MSVNDEAALPWLHREKTFVRRAIERGIPVLGVCLGAQIMASSLGSRVYRNAVKEIGWFSVQGLERACAFPMPTELMVFHWHGETFDLPPGASHLARSAACVHQAFQIGRNAIGLQFHLESTPDSAHAIIHGGAADLTPGPFVQSAAELLNVSGERYSAINATMNNLLSYITQCP